MHKITHDAKEPIPKIGDIGINKHFQKFMWVACVDCGKERWVQMTHGKPLYKRCKKCGSSFSSKRTRELSPHWKGGRRILRNGYIDILVAPTDFFFPMINKEVLYVSTV